MKYIQGTELNIKAPTAVTLGKFDGIHVGHSLLLSKVQEAKARGLKSVVFTFMTPPRALFQLKEVKSLMTNEEKYEYLEAADVDILIEYPFTDAVCHMPPEQFVQKILIDQLNVRLIVVGTDFCFGYKRQGNAEFLMRIKDKYGFDVIVVDKVCDESGREISSTYVREELAAGRMEKVNELLGHPFMVTGEVVHGNRLGRTFGIPTINQIPHKSKMLPPNGVYVSCVEIDGIVYKGVTNVGYKPTIDGDYPKGLETFVFDWSGDLYGRVLTVTLLHFVRGEMKFESKEALIAQMNQDKKTAGDFFTN